jgi:hypothetical protein
MFLVPTNCAKSVAQFANTLLMSKDRINMTKKNTTSEAESDQTDSASQLDAHAERMLTVEEAARQLGYKPSGLYKIIGRTRKGKPGPQLQFYQLGKGPIKFKQQWLDDFIDDNSVIPGPRSSSLSVKKPSRRLANGKRIEIEPMWTLAV